MARTNSNAVQLGASRLAASKPTGKLTVRPAKTRVKVSNPQIKVAKDPKVTKSVDNAGAISSATHQAMELGDSVVTWSKAHPFQAALAAAAVIAL